MTDQTFQLSVEVLRSKTIQYLVIGLFILLILYAAKEWFVKPKIKGKTAEKP